MPEITVLMPVYNSSHTLTAAIDSILNQTFRDFEFLIIDDGSTDDSAKIIRSYKDPRIVFIQNNENIKLIKTLNKGIGLAKGAWIARMDADDIAFPDRLEKQMTFLKENKSFSGCGTQAIIIDSHGNTVGKSHKPTQHLRSWAWIPSPIIHPTVMIKADVLKKNVFDEAALHCEDYELWLRLLKQNIQFTNLKQPLLFYRSHANSVTERFRKIQLHESYLVFKKYFDSVDEESYLTLIGVKASDLSVFKRLKLLKSILKNEAKPCSLLAFIIFKTLFNRGAEN